MFARDSAPQQLTLHYYYGIFISNKKPLLTKYCLNSIIYLQVLHSFSPLPFHFQNNLGCNHLYNSHIPLASSGLILNLLRGFNLMFNNLKDIDVFHVASQLVFDRLLLFFLICIELLMWRRITTKVRSHFNYIILRTCANNSVYRSGG